MLQQFQFWRFAGALALSFLALGSSDLWAQADRQAQADPKAAVPAVADESYTTAEYIRLGMPADDRVWMADDLVKAQQVLAEVAKQGNQFLPRYQSPRSGKIFARLTAPENLAMYRDPALAFTVRFPQQIKFAQTYSLILNQYLAAFVKKEVSGADMQELIGFQLRISTVMLELVDEFLPTIKKDDPKYDIRMKGLAQMRQGLAMIVSGCLQILTERNEYDQASLLRLLAVMEETFPSIVPRIPPGTREEALVRLEKMQTDPALQDLQPALGKVLAVVKKAVDEAAAAADKASK